MISEVVRKLSRIGLSKIENRNKNSTNPELTLRCLNQLRRNEAFIKLSRGSQQKYL